MFDARRLPTFREVARRGSFAAAAEALWLTPSAVSQQIAALEREVGATLFERNHRGVLLTDAGARLLAHADALLDRLAQAELDLKPGGEQRSDRLPPGSLGTATVFFCSFGSATVVFVCAGGTAARAASASNGHRPRPRGPSNLLPPS